MYNLVKIGEKTVPMMSMASTDLYYRNIFHEDAIKPGQNVVIVDDWFVQIPYAPYTGE